MDFRHAGTYFRSGFCSERHEFVARFQSDCSTDCTREELYCLCLRPRLSNRISVDQFLIERSLLAGLVVVWVRVLACPMLESAAWLVLLEAMRPTYSPLSHGRLCPMSAVSGSGLGLYSDELKPKQPAERQCCNGKRQPIVFENASHPVCASASINRALVQWARF